MIVQFVQPRAATSNAKQRSPKAIELDHALRLDYRSEAAVRPDHAEAISAALTSGADELERARAMVKVFEAARERGEDRALLCGLWDEVPT